jgi:parallel beta-helix repeat protein
MVKKITEEVIQEKYKHRNVNGDTFSESVKLDSVDGFEVIECTFTHDDGGDSVLELNNCKNIRLTKCHFPNKKKDHDVVFLDNNCKNIRIKDCNFDGKTNQGNFIDIRDAFNVHIEDCTFKNHKYSGKNGGEAILIGRGKDNAGDFDAHVTHCDFVNCSGDPELISIKQSKTEIVDNTFEGKDWTRGNVSIRFGKPNTIKKNTFKGSGGGIVVRGSGNTISDNIHINNHNMTDDNDDPYDFRPLTLENGKHDDHDTWEYAPAVKNTIHHNTYQDCKGPCIVLGQDQNREQDAIPKENTFSNNIVKADNEESLFLLVPKYRGEDEKRKKIIKANTYENNELRGTRAKPGPLELPAGAFKPA